MENALMERPKCPTHNVYMELRIGQSQEQRFCGTWYDCPAYKCACSILLPSPELQSQLEMQAQQAAASNTSHGKKINPAPMGKGRKERK